MLKKLLCFIAGVATTYAVKKINDKGFVDGYNSCYQEYVGEEEEVIESSLETSGMIDKEDRMIIGNYDILFSGELTSALVHSMFENSIEWNAFITNLASALDSRRDEIPKGVNTIVVRSIKFLKEGKKIEFLFQFIQNNNISSIHLDTPPDQP